MNETHELGGSTIAVDRATPKASYLWFYCEGCNMTIFIAEPRYHRCLQIEQIIALDDKQSPFTYPPASTPDLTVVQLVVQSGGSCT